jgi:phospholipase D1/2
LRELTPDEELMAESDLADPERPAGLRYRTPKLLRRKFSHTALLQAEHSEAR